MEKENKKLKSKLIKEEKKRIKKLVNIAYHKDPRIIKHFKDIEEEKLRRKLEIKMKK